MDVSYSARYAKGEGALPECLDLNQSGAIGLLIQAAPPVGRTVRTIGGVMVDMNARVNVRGIWLRPHLMMGGSTSSGCHAVCRAHRVHGQIDTEKRSEERRVGKEWRSGRARNHSEEDGTNTSHVHV